MNIIKIFCLFISIIVGAGFASGKEVFTFFATQKESSLTVVLVSSLVFFLVTFCTLEISRLNKTTTYTDFLNIIFKNKKLMRMFEISIVFFMFVSFSSMLAGFTSLIIQAFGISKTLARALFVILNFTLLLKGHNSIVKISLFLVPIIFVSAIFFGCLYVNEPSEIQMFTNISFTPHSALNGVTYASYNLITAIAIVCTLSNLYSSKVQNLFASILITISLSLLSISILIPLFSNYDLIKNSDMPIYEILITSYPQFVTPYLLMIVLAILSTSVANAYGTAVYFTNKFNTNYILTILFVILGGIIFSLIGFANIVNFVYPIFGFFGIIEILKILITFFAHKTKD